jgi:pimeloyl-ACP methyl ester carboxylesterase
LFAPPVAACADFLIAWLDANRIERCHVVANSLGCQISADLAFRHPERVATLTLTGPTTDRAAHSPLRQFLRLCTELIREPARLWSDHVVDFFRAGPIRTGTMIRQMFRDRIEEKLPSIAAPTLVVRGEHDAIAPERWVRECAALLPNAQHVTIPGAAHCAHYTEPEKTMRAIQAFIATRQPGAHEA